MKKLLSTKYSAGAFNTAMLLVRICFGVLIMHHGYQKMMGFSTMQSSFPSILGIGSMPSLALSIFAEFFCGLFILIGLFTRLAAIPLIINMGVALFMAHKLDVFGKGEAASLYLAGFVVLLLVGPGRVSVDGMSGK